MMKSMTHPDSGFVKEPKMVVRGNATKKMLPSKETSHPLMHKGTNIMDGSTKGK